MKLLSSANNVNRGGRGSSGGRAWATTEAVAIVVATLVEGAATSHGLATTISAVETSHGLEGSQPLEKLTHVVNFKET